MCSVRSASSSMLWLSDFSWRDPDVYGIGCDQLIWTCGVFENAFPSFDCKHRGKQ